MKIVQAFPCRCRFADKENAPKVEEEVECMDFMLSALVTNMELLLISLQIVQFFEGWFDINKGSMPIAYCIATPDVIDSVLIFLHSLASQQLFLGFEFAVQ